MTGVAAEREARARALLESEGVAGRVRSSGTEGEIAAVSGPGASLEVIQRLAPGLRSLGYRHVALDLSAEAQENQGAK